MTSSQDPQNPKKDNNKKIEDLYEYAKQNKSDSIAHAVLVVGLILMFFWPTFFLGSFLVGCILGLYFSKELVMMVQDRNQLIYDKGTVRSLVFVGTLVAFLIAAPGVFIGAAIVSGVKEFMMTQR